MEPFSSTWSCKYLQVVKARQLETNLGKKKEVEVGVSEGFHGVFCVSGLVFLHHIVIYTHYLSFDYEQLAQLFIPSSCHIINYA